MLQTRIYENAYGSVHCQWGGRSIKQHIADTWRAIKTSVQVAKEAQKKDPTREYMQRPARAINIDGSIELAWGTFVLSAALTVYIGSIRPLPTWSAPVDTALFIVMVLSPLLLPKLIKRFVTWPRTGYVALDQKSKGARMGRNLGFVLGLLGGVGLSLLAIAERQKGFLSPKGIVAGLLAALLLVFAFWCRWLKKDLNEIKIQQPILPAVAPENAGDRSQSAVVTERLRKRIGLSVFAVVLGIFVVVPCVFGAVVYWWLHLAVKNPAHLNLSQTIIALMVFVANPLLYLMLNAVLLKEQVWKWFGFAALALGPLTMVTLFPEIWNKAQNSDIALPHGVLFLIASVWLTSGGATLLLYLRHNPRRSDEAEEGATL